VILDKTQWDVFGGFRYSMRIMHMKAKKPVLTVAVIRGLARSAEYILGSVYYQTAGAKERADIRRAAKWAQSMQAYRIDQGHKL
jgi:hypothetical protein